MRRYISDFKILQIFLSPYVCGNTTPNRSLGSVNAPQLQELIGGGGSSSYWKKRLKKLEKQNLIERKKYKSEKGTDADYFFISEKTLPNIFLYLCEYMYKKAIEFVKFGVKFLGAVSLTKQEDTLPSKISPSIEEFFLLLGIPGSELQSKIINILSKPSILEYIRKEGNGFKLDNPKSHTSRYDEVRELLYYFYVTVYSFDKGDLTEEDIKELKILIKNAQKPFGIAFG
jgi:hypothetical protein